MTGYPVSESLRERVLAVTKSHEPVRDVTVLRELMGVPARMIDLTRALWSLQKSGDITFQERKRGHDSLLTGIRLAKGVRIAPNFRPAPRGRHAVGKDYTDPQHHSFIAQGGPIERLRVVPQIEEIPMTYSANTDIYPALAVIDRGFHKVVDIENELKIKDKAASKLVNRGVELGWILKTGVTRGTRLELTAAGRQQLEIYPEPVIDEEFGTGNTPEVMEQASEVMEQVPEVASIPETSDTHTQYPVADEPVDKSWTLDFPLIADLMSKRVRLATYEAAAKLLEETDAEMALALLEKIQLTDLEKEVIVFVNITLEM